ncbi:ferredoxin [Streptomyces sp. NBC_01361]|uniref:ferredoxin n=1 Tax=Streptomyces sp. NBC_01361 TaxID=2903838 RepID=UPI002E341F48|nr:ferredoxin [Streptomyces sp. NBC_01361]
MPVLKADFGACQGYANCVIAAPDTYDLDDDGVVVLLKDSIPEDDLARVQEAARSCPVSALMIEEA